jgi:hypothetical protein
MKLTTTTHVSVDGVMQGTRRSTSSSSPRTAGSRLHVRRRSGGMTPPSWKAES